MDPLTWLLYLFTVKVPFHTSLFTCLFAHVSCHMYPLTWLQYLFAVNVTFNMSLFTYLVWQDSLYISLYIKIMRMGLRFGASFHMGLFHRAHTQTCTCACVKFHMGVRRKFRTNAKETKWAHGTRRTWRLDKLGASYRSLALCLLYLSPCHVLFACYSSLSLADASLLLYLSPCHLLYLAISPCHLQMLPLCLLYLPVTCSLDMLPCCFLTLSFFFPCCLNPKH